MKVILLVLITFNIYSSDLAESLKAISLDNKLLRLEKPNQVFENLNLRLSKEENSSEGFTNDEYEYSLRFKPVTIGSSELRKKYFENQKKRISIANSEQVSYKVLEVYSRYLEALFYRREISKRKKLDLILKDKVRVLKELLKRGKESISSLVKSEKKLFENTLRLNSLEKEINNNSVKVNSKDFLSLKSLKTLEIEISELSKERKQWLSVQGLNAEKAVLDLKIETDKKDKVLDFVELKVENKEIERRTYDSRVGIRFSFNIPSLKNENLAINEEKIGLIYAKVDAYKAIREEEKDKLESLQGTLSNIQTANLIMNSSFYKNSKKYLSLYRNQEGASPLKLVELNESIYDARIQVDKLKFDSYLSYLRILGKRGDLSQKPSKNFLVERI